MYKAQHNKDGSLKHSTECNMAFGRKDEDCPRCVEMIKGAKPRDSWQKAHYATEYKNAQAAASKHDCIKSKCGVVCTYGEW